MLAEANRTVFLWTKAWIYLPVAFILGWWLFDLQFQWRALAEYQFGWLVLLLAVYLAWERWPTIPSRDQPAPLWLCFALVFLGTPFVLVAELYKQAIASTPASSFCLSIGCVLYIAANVLYLHGWRTLKHFSFPVLFLFLAVPLPGILWSPVVLALKEWITTWNVEVLNLLGIPAAQHANVIRLPNCVVGVDEACSGVRSLQSSMMAGLFIGNLIFKRLGSQFAFFLAAVGLALMGNFFRSLFLSITAYRHGVESLEKFHDAAGWSIFLFTTAGLVSVAWLMNRIDKSSHQLRNSAEPPGDSRSAG